jgi:glycosyltransferase involved in cell wall biosynthesis
VACREETIVPQARILHVAQTTAGGIASYLEEIAAYQAERYGASNVAFLIPSGAEHRPSIDTAQVCSFTSADRGPIQLIDFATSAARTIRRFRPDIVHLHSSFAGAIVRGMLALRRQRPQIVYCPHGWAFSMDGTERRKRAYAEVERRLASVTDLIHNVSQSEQDLALSYGLPPQKMRVLPNGIAWAPLLRRLARSGPLRYIFIGRFDRQKGIDILLEAIRPLPIEDFEFDIVGSEILSGASGTRPEAGTNVTFHGWLARERTLKLLDRADALIMPSRWDAAPIVAIEAMRAGVAVIGSNRGAIPEIVGEGIGGHIFDIDDPGALGRVLLRLDRAALDRLGRSARKRWEERYCADRMNQSTCEAYEDLLKPALQNDQSALAMPPSTGSLLA